MKIPLAEGQVQLALAGAQMSITNSINDSTGNVIAAVGAGNSSIMNNLNMQSIMNTKGFSDGVAATMSGTAQTVSAVKDASILAERNSWALSQTITNDGDKTRALIQSIDKSNDSHLITNLANEIAELRGDRRITEATGNITISNNNTATATQAQQQAQQQQQLQYQILRQLDVLNNDVQSVKQGSVVFNSGRMTDSGNQSAANTKVG